MSLKFGTDGWRAVMAEEFTFANVRRVTAAVERAMSAAGRTEGTVVVGHDTRFLSRRFAETVAATLLASGRRVLLCDQPCPTPAVSCQVVTDAAPFAIVITASHNPAIFNGVKVKESMGSSAGSETTAACEKEIRDEEPPMMSLQEGREKGLLSVASFEPAHRSWLSRVADPVPLNGAGFTVIADPMHGSCGTLLERLLQGGATRVRTLRGDPDPLFGGAHPEPLEVNLPGLRQAVIDMQADVGLATDGDGDRIGAFDEKGNFVSPLKIAPLIALNLIGKGRRGPLGKTFANTILLDRIAARHGLPFSTFPVGFKYIARQMQQGRMLLGGEESGGIGVEGFIPERDGTLIGLLILQAMLDEGKPLSEMIAAMHREYGELHYERRDLACPTEAGRSLVESLKSSQPDSVGGLKVTGFDDLDGLKLLFGDDGWILFRASGTEPVLRVYSEVPSPDQLAAVMDQAMEMVASFRPGTP